MAKSSPMPDCIRDKRSMSISSADPIRTFDRTAYDRNGSLYANLPQLAVENLGLAPSDDIAVEVYDDRVIVKRAD